MSRVSENSSINSINYAVGKTKGRLEDLQMKGSTLKRISKPSDDPIGNTELLAIRSQSIDADQYMRNLNYAQTQLSYTENVLEEMTDILSKAKELAVGQASTLYGPEIRQGVSKEIHQLRQQILSIANKRIGNRYLFSGQKVLTRPFDQNGQYQGDKNKINIEINKDVYVPININGDELFFTKGLQKKSAQKEDLDLKLDVDLNGDTSMVRKPASNQPEEVTVSVFDEMRALENALLTDNPQIVQSLLERLDSSLEKMVAFRTQIGALTNTVTNAESNIEKTKLVNASHKTRIEDADVAELFTDLQKEQTVLKAAYKASSNLMNTNLMDFLR
jgi:flagellar hook-associated protein 3 FlgL